MTSGPTLHVEVWSDVICPWCYIGKRRFERAVEQLAGELTVVTAYRAFQLDPRAPVGSAMPVADAYARKFGGPERAEAIIAHLTAVAASEGLEFRLDRAQRTNTLLAHRLLWLAGEPESPTPQAVVKERLLRGYFTEGLHLGDPDVVAACAAEVGMDADAVERFLSSDAGTAEVRAQLDEAREREITAVPSYLIEGMLTIPGAQEPETFVHVLRRVAARVASRA